MKIKHFLSKIKVSTIFKDVIIFEGCVILFLRVVVRLEVM
jgi:hypothetical protein